MGFTFCFTQWLPFPSQVSCSDREHAAVAGVSPLPAPYAGPTSWVGKATPVPGPGRWPHCHGTPRGQKHGALVCSGHWSWGQPGHWAGFCEGQQGPIPDSPPLGVTVTSTVCVEPHLPPRTPPDAMSSKIHTNVYSAPAWGWGRGDAGTGALRTFTDSPRRRVGLWREDSVQRPMGPGASRRQGPGG